MRSRGRPLPIIGQIKQLFIQDDRAACRRPRGAGHIPSNKNTVLGMSVHHVRIYFFQSKSKAESAVPR
jgi:hypothetical protein